jgi:protein TonB
MLEDCLFASRPSARTKKPFTLVLSIITHVSIAAVLILIPLFQNHLLPQIPFFEPLRPPTLAAQSVELVPVSSSASASKEVMPPTTTLYVPPAIPDEIGRFADEPQPFTGALPLPGGGDRNGAFVSMIGIPVGAPRQPAPPPPPPSPPATQKSTTPEPVPTGPVRVSSMSPSSLLHSVKPEYPRLAVITGTQGAVLIEAVITHEGTIDPARLRVISGHILLVEAAVEAVKQWRYRPTLLNGEPVEVLTTITLNFTLN